jgi:hypothetical protein
MGSSPKSANSSSGRKTAYQFEVDVSEIQDYDANAASERQVSHLTTTLSIISFHHDSIYFFKLNYAEALAKTYNKHTGNTVRIDKSSKKTVSAFIEAMIKKGYGAGNKRDE